MNFTKKLLASSVAASALAAGSIAPVAHAELSASVGIANTYLWRGYELGSGTPVVWGDLSVSSEWGGYAGIWTSSGDATAGTEYDLYAGWGGESGSFVYDIFVVSYVYPTGDFSESDGDPGDFMEVVGTLGFGPASLTVHQNIAGETELPNGDGGYAFTEDYMYYALGLDLGSFSLTLGKHDEGVDDPETTYDATHFDVSYAYNDNLAFTLSTILDSDADDYGEDDPKPTFVVSYTLPLTE